MSVAAAANGPTGDVAAALEQLRLAAADATDGHADVPLSDVLAAMRGFDSVAMQHAVDADIVLETGAALDDTSARWFFAEDGVDPLAAHKAMLTVYTDKDIHDLLAYLVTLK